MEHSILRHSQNKMGAIVQCVFIMHIMDVSNQDMGGDIHARYDSFASTNRDNDYVINEKNVISNQYGSVDNTVSNEQAQKDSGGLENDDPSA